MKLYYQRHAMPHDPLFEKVLLSESSFLVKEEHFARFDIPWHVHPEFELTLISQGLGTINLGDYISDLQGPMLLLIGPNLPHSWYGHESEKRDLIAQQIVIQFASDFLGEGFFENPSFREIGDLLKKSYRGLLFPLSDLKKISDRIKEILQMNDFERTIELLTILHTLARQKQYIELSSIGYSTQLNKTESARLNAIYAFILEHFKSNLDLNRVAQYAHMTPQAFSRYFKERTRRTFVSFLNEVRIGYACRLLTKSDLGISRICYESGYSNLSNFNRQFKRIKSMTPSEYVRGFDKATR
ncbi:MAG: AraC family transcriptional regulator [Bacteroidetes bacterium]|nr:AraC family transcriptional regulator [Bacteroidota bacterium]